MRWFYMCKKSGFNIVKDCRINHFHSLSTIDHVQLLTLVMFLTHLRFENNYFKSIRQLAIEMRCVRVRMKRGREGKIDFLMKYTEYFICLYVCITSFIK